MNTKQLPRWARVAFAVPALIVLYIVVGALDSRLSPARRGMVKACQVDGRGRTAPLMPPLEPTQLFHPTLRYDPDDIMGKREPRCLVEWSIWGMGLGSCPHLRFTHVSGSPITKGACLEVEGNGFLVHDSAGNYVRTDLHFQRTDALTWFGRLAMRGGDEPLKATVLLVVLLAACILPWRRRWSGWIALYPVVAIWGFWVVGPFASVL
jgi:hypothetical protein